MTGQFSSVNCFKLVLFVLFFNTSLLHAEVNTPLCQDNGEYKFICGMNSPEDLLAVPNSDWVIASGFSGNDSWYIIDSKSLEVEVFYPRQAPVARQNMALYGSCPSSPNPNNFTGHGVNVR